VFDMRKNSSFVLLKVRKLIPKSIKRFIKIDGFLLASGLAFELLLSFILFLFLVAFGLGLLFFKFQYKVQLVWLQDVLQGFLPSSREIFTEIIQVMTTNRNQFGLIGFLFFFIFTSSLFGSVRTVLDRIFELNMNVIF